GRIVRPLRDYPKLTVNTGRKWLRCLPMSGTVLRNLAIESRLGDESVIAQTIETSLQQQGSPIGELLEKQLVKEPDFLKEIAAQFGLPWWDTALPPMDEKLRTQF